MMRKFVIFYSCIIFYFLLVPSLFDSSISKECYSMDIRNKPESFKILENCTVIKGFLMIILMNDDNLTINDFYPYQFPKLKEITEYLILYQVYRLRTLRDLFPNLVVIRGEKLFLNYALAIDSVPELSDIGLISLVSIQRGHVYINKCPVLCYVNTIDWSNITQSYGTSIIKQQDNNNCPTRNSCRGCHDERCWSSKECQKFKNDNLLNLMSRIKCHPLCLGGCRNASAGGCNVCKGISDHDVCVEQCPSNKFLIPEYFRCYTNEECKEFRRVILHNECLTSCPAGYSTTDFKTGNVSETHCFPCKDKCPRICETRAVQHLSDAESLRGCTVINGTLQIRITNRINENDLRYHLSSIEEIYGYLKISATSSITSLSFLQGLNKIHGTELDYDKYALVIYYNQNLADLWNINKENPLILARGGMFIHSNYKLCTQKVRQFQNETIHDTNLDYIPKSDVEPSCNPIKLETKFEVLGINSVTILWKEMNGNFVNGTEYILFYTDSLQNNTIQNKADGICYGDVWITQLISQKDFQRDADYFVYNLTNLRQYTKYAFYVKTYGIRDKDDNFSGSESTIKFFRTQADIPSQQNVTTLEKTADSLTLTWQPSINEHERIDYYVIDLFHEPDKKSVLDWRDYCVDQLVVDPVASSQTGVNLLNCSCVDETLLHDDITFQTRFGERFQCDTSRGEVLCRTHRYSNRFRRSSDMEQWPDHISKNFLKRIYFSNNSKTYTITELEPYRLYVFQFFVCNNITGCGSYALHSDRTKADFKADIVVVRLGSFDDGKNQLEVLFDEPDRPNGMTVAYNVNYRKVACGKDLKLLEACNRTICITRLEHEIANFRYLLNLDRTSYQLRVRSISIAGPGPYSEWIDIDTTKPGVVNWYWYLLTIFAMAAGLYAMSRYKKKTERSDASMLIRFPYTDRDQLLLNYEN